MELAISYKCIQIFAFSLHSHISHPSCQLLLHNFIYHMTTSHHLHHSHHGPCHNSCSPRSLQQFPCFCVCLPHPAPNLSTLHIIARDSVKKKKKVNLFLCSELFSAFPTQRKACTLSSAPSVNNIQTHCTPTSLYYSSPCSLQPDILVVLHQTNRHHPPQVPLHLLFSLPNTLF